MGSCSTMTKATVPAVVGLIAYPLLQPDWVMVK
jgi:hypothetical protein